MLSSKTIFKLVKKGSIFLFSSFVANKLKSCVNSTIKLYKNNTKSSHSELNTDIEREYELYCAFSEFHRFTFLAKNKVLIDAQVGSI